MATAEPEPDVSRLRAGSRILWEKVHRSPSRSSQGGRGRVSEALGQAGVLSGSVGSPLIDPNQQRHGALQGANVFLQELERVASRSAARPGIERKGTIELELSEASHGEDVHPITSVEQNPFEVKDDGASDKSYDFTEDIRIINDDAKHAMRALLDTGMKMNAIHHDKALKSGFHVSKYTGPRLKDADGPDFDPIGQVTLQFYFKSYRSARTWDLDFVVLRDPPFDVALGSAFIKNAGLLKRSDVALPMAFSHMTEEERRHQEEKTRKINADNERVKAEEKKKMDARWRPDKEKRDKAKDKKSRH